MEKLYLLEGSGELGDDPADGKQHPGEQQHLPGLGHHEEDQEDEPREVPHEVAELLAQGLAHRVGAGGDVGHQLSCTGNKSP